MYPLPAIGWQEANWHAIGRTGDGVGSVRLDPRVIIIEAEVTTELRRHVDRAIIR